MGYKGRRENAGEPPQCMASMRGMAKQIHLIEFASIKILRGFAFIHV
jgi:hypothetical protein